jgi:hypothetical protein
MKFCITIAIVLLVQLSAFCQPPDDFIIQDTVLFGNKLDLLATGSTYPKVKKLMGKSKKVESSGVNAGVEGGPSLTWHTWLVYYKEPKVELKFVKVTKLDQAASLNKSTLRQIAVTEGTFTVNKHELEIGKSSYARINGCLYYFQKNETEEELEIISRGNRYVFNFDEDSILTEILVVEMVQLKVLNN